MKIKFINKTLIEKFHKLILEDKRNYEIKNIENNNYNINNLLGKKRTLSPKKTENINPNIKTKQATNKKINEMFKKEKVSFPKDFSNASKIIETQRKLKLENNNNNSLISSLPTSSSSKNSLNSSPNYLLKSLNKEYNNNIYIPSSYETVSSLSNSNFFNYNINRNNSDLIQENFSFKEKDNFSLDSSFIFSRNDSYSNLSDTNKKSYNGINFRLSNSRLEKAIRKSTSKKNSKSKNNSISKLESARKMIEKNNNNMSFDDDNINLKTIDVKKIELKNLVQEKFYNNTPIKKNLNEDKNYKSDNSDNSKIIAMKTPEKNFKEYKEFKLKDKTKRNLFAYFSQKQIS